MIIKRSEYVNSQGKKYPTLQFWRKPDDKFPILTLGTTKANVVVENINEIKKFLQEFSK